MDDQSKFLDAEDMVPCPYNEAHIVTRKRLAIHITKCRKQHTELSKDMKQCSHNIQHIIPREEFEYHLQICPDRDNHYLSNFKIGGEKNDDLPTMMENMTIPTEENWDDEPKCSNILANIQEMAKKKVVLNSFSNEPPAIRKALRMENRRKTREKLNQDPEEFVRRKTEFTEQSSSKIDDYDDASVVSAASMNSRASSFATDISFKTAMTSASKSMQSFEEVGERKVLGRGRSARILSTETTLKQGIGRSRLIRN